MARLVRVAVPAPLRELLTYRVPEGWRHPPCGGRVVVPLGARVVTGCVVERDTVDTTTGPKRSLESYVRIAGVIGLPANDGTPRVWYGTLRPTTEGIIVETQALEYDHEAAARKMIECGLQGYAETLRSGLWPSLDVLPAAERDATGRPLASHSAFWTRQGLNPSRRDCAVP